MGKVRDEHEIEQQLQEFERQYDLIASSSSNKRESEMDVLLAKIGVLRWVLNNDKSFSSQRIFGC